VQQENWLAEGSLSLPSTLSTLNLTFILTFIPVRNVTVAFIKLPMGTTKSSDPIYTTLLQKNGEEIIKAIAKFEGMLAHISYDDKGVSAFLLLLLLFNKLYFISEDICSGCIWSTFT
jgi:hypothetical protein